MLLTFDVCDMNFDTALDIMNISANLKKNSCILCKKCKK